METLEELRKKYDDLNKKRNAIYRKIVELERQEVTNAFTVVMQILIVKVSGIRWKCTLWYSSK